MSTGWGAWQLWLEPGMRVRVVKPAVHDDDWPLIGQKIATEGVTFRFVEFEIRAGAASPPRIGPNNVREVNRIAWIVGSNGKEHEARSWWLTDNDGSRRLHAEEYATSEGYQQDSTGRWKSEREFRSTKTAAKELSDRIRLGYYPKGSQLPRQPALATELGTSRTTIVRACAVLAAQGLVELDNGNALTVVRLHPKGSS